MSTAVSDIWNEFHKELKAFIAKRVRNETDTEDILQEVFIKIIRHLDKVHQAENLRQYLYRIVRNTINDYFRIKQHYGSDTDFAEILSEEETQSLNATIADCCIKPFINQLPYKYKEALLITEFQDISQKDLAKSLNISYSGAKSRVQRGKEKLKELILKCCAYQSDAYGNLMEAEKKDCNCS